MDRFRGDFDDLPNRFPDARPPRKRGANPALALESYIEGDKLIIRADLPGVDLRDVAIAVTGNELRIGGKASVSWAKHLGS